MSLLEFIASLKWPVVLLVVLGVIARGIKNNPEFGKWFRDWADRRDFRGKFGPAEMSATTPATQAALQTAVSSDHQIAEAALELLAEQPANENDEAILDLEGLRRDAVEDVMRLAAQWGWEMAQMGFRSPPDPHIEWSENGAPRILFGAGSGGAVTRTVVIGEDGVLNAAEINRRNRAALQQAIRDRMERQHGEDESR